MSFWKTENGEAIAGTPEAAFVPEFGNIPNNTRAIGAIKKFELVEKDSQYTGPQRYYEIVYWITSQDFKGREVTQKIKPFYGKPEQIERAKNMLMLIMKLCKYKPSHSEEPKSSDVRNMVGNHIGIVIREWSMEKSDGEGLLTGNFVAEVHDSNDFECSVGKALAPRIPASSSHGHDQHLDMQFSNKPTRHQVPIDIMNNLSDNIPF